jgi:uncharacterized protein (TIGR00251 family)
VLSDLYQVHEDGSISLAVHAQPGAGRSAIVGRHGDALKVRVAAPPDGGRANAALTTLLATTLGLADDGVALTAGDHSRTKRFRITGIEPADFERLVEQAIEQSGAPGGASAARVRGTRNPRR